MIPDIKIFPQGITISKNLTPFFFATQYDKNYRLGIYTAHVSGFNKKNYMFPLKLKKKNNDFIKSIYLPRNPNPSFYKPFRSEILSKYRFCEEQVESPKSLEQNRLEKRILKTTKLCYEKNLTKIYLLVPNELCCSKGA